MMSNIVGCPPDDLRIGMNVHLDYQDLDIGVTLPVFRPAGLGADAR